MSPTELPLTDRAKLVISEADSRVVEWDDELRSTIHVLQALLRHPRSGASYVLSEIGLNRESLATALAEIAGIEKMKDLSSAGVRALVAEARGAAEQLEGSFIGAEHLLVAVLRSGNPIVQKAIESFGISLEDALSRAEPVVKAMSRAGESPKHGGKPA